MVTIALINMSGSAALTKSFASREWLPVAAYYKSEKILIGWTGACGER